MKKIIFPVFCIIAGIGLWVTFTNIFYVKKYVIVKINSGIATFESNVNRDGDIYTIIINEDTVSRGVVVDGKWK